MTTQPVTPGAREDFRLQVFGINVEPGRGHDDLFCSAAKTEVAAFVEGGDIAGRHPLGFRRNDATVLPGGARNGFAPDQDFAIRRRCALRARALLCRCCR